MNPAPKIKVEWNEMTDKPKSLEEPREFQIYKAVRDDDEIWSATEESGSYECMIHVIEYSAYADLKAKLEIAREALEKTIYDKDSLEAGQGAVEMVKVALEKLK